MRPELLNLLTELANPNSERKSIKINNLNTEEYAKLVEALKNNTKIKELDLGNSSIDHEGAKEYSAPKINNMNILAFHNSRDNKFLNKVDNKTWSKEVKGLAAVLPQTAITKLILRNHKIEIKEIKELAAALPQTAITELDLGNNNIGPGGAAELAAALPRTAITKLNLENNDIGPAGAEALAAVLPRTAITELDLGNNNISHDREHLKATMNIKKLLAKNQVIALNKAEAIALVANEKYEEAIAQYKLLQQISHAEDYGKQIEELSGRAEMKQIFQVLDAEEPELRDSGLNALMLLGRTGAGKSTSATALAGGKLLATPKGSVGRLQLGHFDDAGNQEHPIGHDMSSTTTVPKKRIAKMEDGQEIVIWDCPGSGDTGGIVQEVANSYYISKVFQNTEKVKLVLTVTQSLICENKGTEFINDVKHVVKMFKDPSILIGKLGLLVTRAELETQSRYIKVDIEDIISNKKNLDPDIKKILESLNTEYIQIFHKPKESGQFTPKLSLSAFERVPAIKTKDKGGDIAFPDEYLKHIQMPYNQVSDNIKVIGGGIMNALRFTVNDTKVNRPLVFKQDKLDQTFISKHLADIKGYDDSRPHIFQSYFPALQQLLELKKILQTEEPDRVKTLLQVLDVFKNQTTDQGLREQLANYAAYLTRQADYLDFFGNILKNQPQKQLGQALKETIEQGKKAVQTSFYELVKETTIENNAKIGYYREFLNYLEKIPMPQEKAIKLKTGHIHFKLAHAQQPENIQYILQHLLKAVQCERDFLGVTYKNIGYILESLNAPTKALNYYNCVTSSEDAEKCLEKMIKNNPTDYEVYINVAKQYLKMGKNQKATELYNKILQLISAKDLVNKTEALKKGQLYPCDKIVNESDKKLYEDVATKLCQAGRAQPVLAPGLYNSSHITESVIAEDLAWVNEMAKIRLAGDIFSYEPHN